MTNQESSKNLELISIERQPLTAGLEKFVLRTNAGDLNGILHLAQTASKGGIVWVGGAGGGLHGPAGGLYPRLSEQLAAHGIFSLRLDYRAPNDFIPCVLDTLLGIGFLETLKAIPVVLVGHSFGGAVVITAGALNEAVHGVVTLASQTAGTKMAKDLGARRVFLAHGSADRVLPDRCTLDIHQRIPGPKDLHLYPACGHNFDECGAQLEQDLLLWMYTQFQLDGPFS